MANHTTTLHFVLFPVMTPGHMIPMVDMARMLAQTGASVTIVTTPVNANRFKPVITRAIQANLKIQVLELELRLAEVGLPEGCESFDMLPNAELAPKLFAAMDMLEQPAEKLLGEMSPFPSCIISDNLFPWTSNLAKRFNIPRIVFHGPGCVYLLSIHGVLNGDFLERIESDTEKFVVPGLPDRIEVTKMQISGVTISDKEEIKELFARVKEAEEAAYGIVVNSFEELEFEYVREVAKVKGKKVWCVGPVSLSNKSSVDMLERGNKAMINEHDCLKWLDARETASVVCVCLGSLSRSSTGQMIELGLGLELSNRPFVWCVRHTTKELQKWISEGFGERVKDRGLIVQGWAPQVLILSHRAVGAFVTHCGWNSTLEGVSAGLPMGTWPHFAEQFLNERFIVDVLKIGVRTGVEIPVVFGEQEKFGVLVSKEDVKATVEKLMDGGEDGRKRRDRARELGAMAKRAMEEGGSSRLNFAAMIQDISEQLAKTIKLDQ